MFYDERIEGVRGRISRTAILISLIICAVLGGLHVANIARNATDVKYYWLAGVEIAIVIGTAAVLAVGLIRGALSQNDERTRAEQSSFYSSAATALIKFALGVFAFIKPIEICIGKPGSFADAGLGSSLYVLMFVVGAYVIYSFKGNDIYFNYSILDSEHYYGRVFANIGKMALYALAYLGISAVSVTCLVIVSSLSQAAVLELLLQLPLYSIGVLTVLSVLYFLYSFLEYTAYTSKSPISRATVISLFITVLIYAAYTACVILLDSLPISQANAAMLVSAISGFEIYIRFALIIFLTYFAYEYRRVRKSKLISAAYVTVLLGESISMLLSNTSRGALFVLMPEIMRDNGYILINTFADINVCIELATSLAAAVGLTLAIVALMRDGYIRKWHVLFIVLIAIFGCTELFLRTQIGALGVSIYRFITEILSLCYCGVLVAAVGRKQRAECGEE